EGKYKFKYSDGMIVYPIYVEGNVVSFKFKYKISDGEYIKAYDGDSRLEFNLAKEFTGEIFPRLYNIDVLKENKEVVAIVEGEGDVISYWGNKDHNVIGTGGGVGSTNDTIDWLNETNVDFKLGFDMDIQGKRYSIKFINQLKNVKKMMHWQGEENDIKDCILKEIEIKTIKVTDWVKQFMPDELIDDNFVSSEFNKYGGITFFNFYVFTYFEDGKNKERRVPIHFPTKYIL
ncbi:hypothetical protein B6I21_04655, partial [candidate division KSB1 bacterium 4572_119]